MRSHTGQHVEFLWIGFQQKFRVNSCPITFLCPNCWWSLLILISPPRKASFICNIFMHCLWYWKWWQFSTGIFDVVAWLTAMFFYRHISNLFTTLPPHTCEHLIPELSSHDEASLVERSYDGHDVSAIAEILKYLDIVLEGASLASQKEQLLPVITSLTLLARSHRVIRKFCRLRVCRSWQWHVPYCRSWRNQNFCLKVDSYLSITTATTTYFETVWTGRQFSKILVVFQVLPHLRDEVKRLPEEGDSLRNRLCKLLTTPHTEVTINLH